MTSKATPSGNTAATGGSRADPRAQLREAGLRVTKPRLAILSWLRGHPHSTADQVASAVRRELGSVSTQAIYDVLNACIDAGILRRIEPAGHPARFETRIGDNHHHLVCRTCGRTEDVDCVQGAALCLIPSSTAGYAVDEAEVVFWGQCPDCCSSQHQRSHPEQNQGSHHEEERS